LSILAALKSWAWSLKRDVVALWLAARDPRTPFLAKIVAALVAAYALSPIDLIPDFIPVLGYLDDLIIVPLGVLAVVRMIAPALMQEFRDEASRQAKPISYMGVTFIVVIWLAVAAGIAWRFGPLATSAWR
jgi:uncharacterized membrane protein YkvA (DUF1232 family)